MKRSLPSPPSRFPCSLRHSAVLAVGLAACGGLCLTGCGAAKPPPDDIALLGGGGEQPAPPVASGAGEQLIQEGKWQEAIAHFDEVLAGNPQDAQANYYRAVALDQLGKRDEAEKAYLKTLEINPDMLDARVNLGVMYLLDPAQPEKAIEMLKAAAKLDPGAIDIRENLALALQLAKRYEDAAKQLEAALQAKPSGRVHLSYADLLFEMGKNDAGLDQLRKAMPHYSQDVKTLVTIGLAFTRAKAFDDCVRAFDMALQTTPDKAGLLARRAACQYAQKKVPEAVADYQQAMKVNPKFQPAPFYLGKVYAETGKKAEAAEAFKKAIEIGKDTPLGKNAKQALDAL